MDPVDRLVRQENEVQLVLRGLQDRQDQMGNQEVLALQDHKDPKVNGENLGHQVLQVNLEAPENEALEVQQDLLDPWGHQGRQGNREKLV